MYIINQGFSVGWFIAGATCASVVLESNWHFAYIVPKNHVAIDDVNIN